VPGFANVWTDENASLGKTFFIAVLVSRKAVFARVCLLARLAYVFSFAALAFGYRFRDRTLAVGLLVRLVTGFSIVLEHDALPLASHPVRRL
jgi:hypothetical protein